MPYHQSWTVREGMTGNNAPCIHTSRTFDIVLASQNSHTYLKVLTIRGKQSHQPQAMKAGTQHTAESCSLGYRMRPGFPKIKINKRQKQPYKWLGGSQVCLLSWCVSDTPDTPQPWDLLQGKLQTSRVRAAPYGGRQSWRTQLPMGPRRSQCQTRSPGMEQHCLALRAVFACYMPITSLLKWECLLCALNVCPLFIFNRDSRLRDQSEC